MEKCWFMVFLRTVSRLSRIWFPRFFGEIISSKIRKMSVFGVFHDIFPSFENLVYSPRGRGVWGGRGVETLDFLILLDMYFSCVFKDLLSLKNLVFSPLPPSSRPPGGQGGVGSSACVCVCVCVYVCMYVCVCICMCVCVYVVLQW